MSYSAPIKDKIDVAERYMNAENEFKFGDMGFIDKQYSSKAEKMHYSYLVGFFNGKHFKYAEGRKEVVNHLNELTRLLSLNKFLFYALSRETETEVKKDFLYNAEDLIWDLMVEIQSLASMFDYKNYNFLNSTWSLNLEKISEEREDKSLEEAI